MRTNIKTRVFFPQDYTSFSVDDVALSHEKEKALALAVLKLPDAVDSLVQVFVKPRFVSICAHLYSFSSTLQYCTLRSHGTVCRLVFSGASSVAPV